METQANMPPPTGIVSRDILTHPDQLADNLRSILSTPKLGVIGMGIAQPERFFLNYLGSMISCLVVGS